MPSDLLAILDNGLVLCSQVTQSGRHLLRAVARGRLTTPASLTRMRAPLRLSYALAILQSLVC